jgi:hypothetical protein
MSISNRHSVVQFVSGETKAMSGQRLLKIGYKGRGNKPAKFASVAASVPMIQPSEVSERLQRLLPYIGTMLENAQDAVARSLYESSQGQLKELADSDISLDACINFMEAEANGSRLTAERIKDWFVSELSDNLSVWVAEKLGFEELNEAQTDTVNKQVNAYAAVFQSLSSKGLTMELAKIAKLENALSLCADDGNEIAQKISVKLQALKNPAPVVPIEELL